MLRETANQRSAFLHLNFTGNVSQPCFHAERQVLHAAHGHIIPEKRTLCSELNKYFNQFFLVSFHARRGDLDAEQISVAVDDQTGEPVALTVAETVVRYVEQTFAQFPGPAADACGAGRCSEARRSGGDDARGDERGGLT